MKSFQEVPVGCRFNYRSNNFEKIKYADFNFMFNSRIMSFEESFPGYSQADGS